MNIQYILFHTVGGLGLFLFGMKTMSEGLQQVAGDRMRRILETVSANRVVACLTGTVVTALIQSSSATTVMLVGFVNAGLLSLSQAVGVALGANIGTTVTAQLIAFKITDAALPAIAVGVAMRLFAKKRRTRDLGAVILGFGLLFFGMIVMKMGVGPLKDSPTFVEFFTKFQADSRGGVLLCILTGAVVTMVLQSSSATVGLTMTLASQGLLNFPGAVALVLGDNIGTTITAELASIGTSANSHRTARAHTMFNVLGVCYMFVLFPWFVEFVSWMTANLFGLGPPDALIGGEKPHIARYIANAHTMFNVINAMVFLSILPLLLRAATWMSRVSDDDIDRDIGKPRFLDTQFLNMPTVALEQARQETLRMGEIAEETMVMVIESLEHRNLRTLRQWQHRENAIDLLQREITNYLVQISRENIRIEESREISSLMRMVNNIERIGDSVENVAQLIEEMIENDLLLAEDGMKDYKEISSVVIEFFRFVLEGIREGDRTIMARAQELEDQIDLMRESMRGNYLMRLRTGVCAIDPGLIFTDLLNHFEKMGDYCFNVAQAVAGVK